MTNGKISFLCLGLDRRASFLFSKSNFTENVFNAHDWIASIVESLFEVSFKILEVLFDFKCAGLKRLKKFNYITNVEILQGFN